MHVPTSLVPFTLVFAKATINYDAGHIGRLFSPSSRAGGASDGFGS